MAVRLCCSSSEMRLNARSLKELLPFCLLCLQYLAKFGCAFELAFECVLVSFEPYSNMYIDHSLLADLLNVNFIGTVGVSQGSDTSPEAR